MKSILLVVDVLITVQEESLSKYLMTYHAFLVAEQMMRRFSGAGKFLVIMGCTNAIKCSGIRLTNIALMTIGLVAEFTA